METEKQGKNWAEYRRAEQRERESRERESERERERKREREEKRELRLNSTRRKLDVARGINSIASSQRPILTKIPTEYSRPKWGVMSRSRNFTRERGRER